MKSILSILFGAILSGPLAQAQTLGAPKRLTATVSSSSEVSLKWTDASSKEDNFLLERSLKATSAFQQIVSLPKNSIAYVNAKLSANTTYYFRVRASRTVNGVVRYSGYSNVVQAKTLSAPVDTQAPSIPQGLSASAVSASQINVSYSASTDNVGVTGYRVERCQGAACTNFVQVEAPAGLSYSSSGLSASTLYRFRVRAVDAAGNLSAYSSIAQATTPALADTQAPSVPQNLAAVVSSSSQINISYSASTDNVGVTGYRVERCQGAACTNFVQVGTPAGLSYSNTGLSAGTLYRFRVRAVDAASNLSPYSAIAQATTSAVADTQAPSAPQNLSAVASSSSQINLSYSASTDNVGVAGYRVERCQGASCTNFVQVEAPVGLSHSSSGLVASTLYRFRVRAVDAAGNLSAYSAIAQATTSATSTSPNLVTVFDCNSSNFVATSNASSAPCAVDVTGWQNPPNGFEIPGSPGAEASVENGKVYLSRAQDNGGHLGTNMVYQRAVNVRAFEATFTFVPSGKNIAFVVQNANNSTWGFNGKNFDSGAGCEAGFFQAFDTTAVNNIFALAIQQDQALVSVNDNPNATFTHSSAMIYKSGESPCTYMAPPQWSNVTPFSIPTQISTYPVSLNSPASVPLTTTGHNYSAKITYDGSNVTLNLHDITAGGSCPGSSCFTHTWTGVNIPALVGANTAWVSLSAGCNSDCAQRVNVNSFKYAAPSSSAP